MTEAFVDTSGWACYFLRSERFHPIAQKTMWHWRQQGTNVVTTNYILIELVAL